MGTPEFALPTLKKLKEKHEILVVITQPDKPKGRRLHPAISPVKEFSLKNHIPILQPENLKDNAQLEEQLRSLSLDVGVVAAYGNILPNWLLELPKYGCINLHASLLPQYRGAAPIQRAIMDGKKETGVTSMRMSEGLDEGDIYLQAKVEIEPDDNTDTLGKKLAEVGAELIMKTLEGIESRSLTPKPQDNTRATFAEKIVKEESRIDWRENYQKIWCRVRALAPSPGAYTVINNKRVKVLAAEPKKVSGFTPGAVVSTNKELVIAAGDGAVLLKTVQPEGKRAMSGEEFLRGYRLKKDSSIL